MANINTRNVHRSNMLMGFPYGRDFVYDEMMLTGPGEKGEEQGQTHPGGQHVRENGQRRAEARRGPVEGGTRDRPL